MTALSDNDVLAGVEPLPSTAEVAEELTIAPSREAIVKAWLSKIEDAEKKWERDFKRMRSNMEFAAGRQWEDDGQRDGEEPNRYQASGITSRTVQQKVSALYARDPKAIAKRRERRDFALWDGKIESLVAAFQKIEMAFAQGGNQNPALMGAAFPNEMALLNDYQHGKELQAQIDAIGETLEVVYQWMVDSQEPEFKKQMKQLVRRVVTCGVGYVKLTLETGGEPLTTDGLVPDKENMLQRTKQLIKEMTEDGAGPDDKRVEEVQSLLKGIHGPQEIPGAQQRLSFSFPSATCIIPDKKCRCLKDFVGADWAAERFRRPLSEVNAFFDIDIELTSEVRESNNRANARALSPAEVEADPLVTLYEVYNRKDKTRFFVCKGHNDWVLEPEAVMPPTKRFWPWFSLCFNDVEVEDDLKVSIFPPSDVHLITPAQKEWNRSRDALRDHRVGSIPFFITTVPLSTDDVQRLKGIQPNDVIQLQSMPAGTDAQKVLAAFLPAPLNPEVYNTAPIQQDILMSVGEQTANLGPTSGATATESTIAEQSRLSHSSSNVDDLDDLLSDVARAGGELLLRGVPEETIKQIAGPGAVWPPASEVETYVNEIYLQIEAASSGRPNRALDENKFKTAAPLLLQAGANPKAVIEWGAKMMDIKIPLEDLFPVQGAMMPQGAPPAQPDQVNQNPAPSKPAGMAMQRT